MDRNKIYVTRKIPEPGVEKLKKIFHVDVSPFDRNLTQDEIIQRSSGAQGLVSMLNDNIDRELIDRLSSIRIIANYAVGFNNIDVEYAREKGIKLFINPDSHSIRGLYDYKYGINTARKGWLEKDDIINSRTAAEVLKYLQDKKEKKDG